MGDIILLMKRGDSMGRLNSIQRRWTMLVIILAIIIGASIYVWMNQMNKEDKSEKKPVESTSYRSSYHFTAPDKWKNDPQKPIFYNGQYHYYYLYNKDYPDGNGTEWRHATSEDLVHWKDEGVAIPKYTNKNGDPWSGSVVVDRNNTAGFGEDAFIAVVTQPSEDGGKQEQYLWYSTDEGKTFQSAGDEPVLSNPGIEDFRDPKIIWDDERDKWVMLLAEGSKIGFYESGNLKEWKFTGDFQTEDYGVLECPDLFQMRGPNGTVKWVLGMSANGEAVDKPNNYAYWIGDFNGENFEKEHEEPQWLDYGFDWYGGVTFEDGQADDKLNKRYGLAWMNKWSYADNTPTMEADGFNGTDSIVREITLQEDEQYGYALASQPVADLKQLVKSEKKYNDITLIDESNTLDMKGETYRIEADVSWEDSENIGLRLRESEDKSRHVDVGLAISENYSYVNRAFVENPDEEKKFQESQAPFGGNNKNARLTVLVDKTSVEVFIDGGKVVHTNLVFPLAEDQGISLFSSGGTATFENVKVEELGTNQKK